jgi:hypothetical protein
LDYANGDSFDLVIGINDYYEAIRRRDFSFHSGVAENSNLVGCDAMSLGEWLPTFQRIVVLLSSLNLQEIRNSTGSKIGIFCHSYHTSKFNSCANHKIG